jgi:hypothetical protein
MMDLSDVVATSDMLGSEIVTCTVEGVLEESDLRELLLSKDEAAETPAEVDDPADLTRLKERHHSVARMLASGLNQRMVATICKYDEAYLSVLLNAPAMQELVAFYRIQNGNAAQVIGERLRTVGLKAVEKLDEKIDAGELSNQELLGTAKLGLDRGGYGPSSTHHNINEDHIIDHAEILRRSREAETRNAEYIVPASEVRAALAPPKEQKDDPNGQVGSQADRLHEDRGEPQQQGEGE